MRTFIYTIAIFLLSSSVACAAEIYVSAPKTTTEGQNFSVLVNLDTGGIPINSFDIKLSYPVGIVSFAGYKEDGAIKRIWLTSPIDKDGEVHFSGIIPGGVDGLYNPDEKGTQSIPMLELLFYAENEGQGEFIITSSNILRNDGRGTSLPHNKTSTLINVSKSLDVSYDKNLSNNNLSDKVPPDPFSIEFVEAGFFSRTPSMIVFSTTDIDSGVRFYELRVSRDKWKHISSPVPISKGLIKRDIVVRAEDFAGNTRESSVEIPGILSGVQLLGLVLIGVICYLIYFVLKRKR